MSESRFGVLVYLLCLVTFLWCFIIIICVLNAVWGRGEGGLSWLAACADGSATGGEFSTDRSCPGHHHNEVGGWLISLDHVLLALDLQQGAKGGFNEWLLIFLRGWNLSLWNHWGWRTSRIIEARAQGGEQSHFGGLQRQEQSVGLGLHQIYHRSPSFICP